jgi:hypothetical protein
VRRLVGLSQRENGRHKEQGRGAYVGDKGIGTVAAVFALSTVCSCAGQKPEIGAIRMLAYDLPLDL